MTTESLGKKCANNVLPCPRAYEKSGYEKTIPCVIASSVAIVAGAAIIAIQALGLVGILSSSIVGWTTVGLGGTILLSHLLAGKHLANRTFALITMTGISLAIAALGALGATKILTMKQMAYSVIGFVVGANLLAAFLVPLCTQKYAARQLKSIPVIN